MRRLAAILVLLVLWLPGPAPAQGDPRLDKLFERLKAARDAEEAQPIEVDIWRGWIAAGGPAAESLVFLGIVSMQRGDLVGALGLFDAVTVQNPDYAEGWNKRATVLFLMGALDASAADCAKVLALEPRHFGGAGADPGPAGALGRRDEGLRPGARRASQSCRGEAESRDAPPAAGRQADLTRGAMTQM